MIRVTSFLFTLLISTMVFSGCRQQQASQSHPAVPPLTAELIRSTSDDNIEQLIVDHVSSLIGKDYEHEYQIVTRLSPGFQMVYTTWWVEAEVNNGGFNQYFWNSSGAFANEALDGFLLIGATKNADLMQRAIATFVKEEPTQKQFKMRGDIKAFTESYKHTDLNKLDDEYYNLQEDVQALRVKYIRAHLDQFTGK